MHQANMNSIRGQSEERKEKKLKERVETIVSISIEKKSLKQIW